jgi:hypothetical protein
MKQAAEQSNVAIMNAKPPAKEPVARTTNPIPIGATMPLACEPALISPAKLPRD